MTIPAPREWRRADYLVSTEPSLLDIDAIHAFLTRSSWAEGIDKETVRQSLSHSLCFGLYHGTRQIGFARLVTDYATFGYLCDVYVLEAHQKRRVGPVAGGMLPGPSADGDAAANHAGHQHRPLAL